MLNRYARALVTRAVTPLARGLLRRGVRPDAVTLVGTGGVVAGALAFYPRGDFFWGSLVVTCFVLADVVDGTMARLSGRSTRWGAFLDSSLDRVGDAAVFGGLVLWYAGRGADPVLAAVALWCLVGGALTSYVKARAEGLGATCEVGLAERAERLTLVLVTTGLSGLFPWPWLRAGGLWLLAVAALVTVLQRVVAVRRQLVAAGPPGAA